METLQARSFSIADDQTAMAGLVGKVLKNVDYALEGGSRLRHTRSGEDADDPGAGEIGDVEHAVDVLRLRLPFVQTALQQG